MPTVLYAHRCSSSSWTSFGSPPQKRVFRALVAEEDEWAVDPDQLKLWIRRFFQLWSRNQWKRERYAPSFHLDDRNLDPRTWCRFPILSGGFRRELEEMDGV